jgi:hypothetical protein
MTTILAAAGTLLACGARDSSLGRSEGTASVSEAVTGPTTLTFHVSLPQGASIVDTTLGSAGAVSFGAGAKVFGPTRSAGGLSEVQPGGTTQSITTGGSVKIDDRASVTGGVTAAGTITVSSTATVTGATTPSASGLSPATTAWSVTNPGTSQGPITLQNGAVAAPLPNVYDAVVVNANSSLFLSTGTYFFQSLDLESSSKLFVDSSHGPVFVYIASAIIYRGAEKDPNGAIPSLFVGYFGTTQAVLESAYNGVFLAPNAPLHLQNPQPTTNIGTFYAQSVQVDPSETIRPGSFDWTQVQGMPPPPGGFANHGGADGTGEPGVPGITGGTGSPANQGHVTVGALPPSAVKLHVTNQPDDGMGPPGIPPTASTTVTPPSHVPFHVPATFDVGGVLANGTVTLTYTSCTGQAVTCQYHGGSTSDTPKTDLDLEAGRTAALASCSDGQPATALRCGTSFGLSVQGTPRFPVTVDLSLDDRACDSNVDLLTPLQTRQMIDSFSWPSPILATPPTVAEQNADGTPALYYAWVYLHNSTDQLRLRKMYVHILSRPLFTSELEANAGQCVHYQNPGDGFGTFVPVVMPGKVYNTILNVQNTAFQQKQNPKLQPGDPLFKAVILRSTTPLNFAALRASGFRYLDYEPSPLPTQAAMQLQGGGAVNFLESIEQFALGVLQDIGSTVTNALGDLDAIFANRINYTMTINAANLNPRFSSPQMTRAWGSEAGLALGAGGLKVTLYENLLGVFPETFNGYTNDQGVVTIQPASNGAGVLAGYGFCITLRNDAVWASSFLMPDDVCNLQGLDRFVVGVATEVSTNPVNIADFSQDRTVPLTLGDGQLNAVYAMTDAFTYSKRVVGYTPPTAHVLVSEPANVVGSFHDGRAFTDGLHLRNESDSQIANLIAPFPVQVYAGFNDQISSGGVALGVPGPIAWLISTFANNDIILPDSSIDNSREVGTHEYGHYILLSMLHDQNPTAIDELIGDTIFSGQGGNNSYSTRYLNEAFADFISGQVTAIANYRWVTGQDPNSVGPTDKVCVRSPCFDRNFTSGPTTNKDAAGIARASSLLHDAFDGRSFAGQPVNQERNIDQPDNADSWVSQPVVSSPFGFSTLYGYTSKPFDNFDEPDPVFGISQACRVGTGPQAPGPLSPDAGSPTPACIASESVALPGASLVTFAHNLQKLGSPFPPFLTDQIWNTALDQTMAAAGATWCQRCQVLALHTSENAKDNLNAQDILKLCWRGGSAPTTGEDPNLANWQLPFIFPGTQAPDANLRLDSSTCQTCPPSKFPDPNGQCTVDCPADFVVDGNTAPLTSLTEETTATSLAPGSDPCGSEFIVEIDHPDQFFAGGAIGIGSTLSVDAPSASSCAQTFALTFADLPSTTGFVAQQTVTDTASLQVGGLGSVCVPMPSLSLVSSQITTGGAPIRFETSATAGVSFTLNIATPAKTP